MYVVNGDPGQNSFMFIIVIFCFRSMTLKPHNVVESLTVGCNRLKKKVLGDSPIIKYKVAWLYLHLWGFRGEVVDRGEVSGDLSGNKSAMYEVKLFQKQWTYRARCLFFSYKS